MSEPTVDYLIAKAELCNNLAEENKKQGEIELAIKNLKRANSALSRIFNLEESKDENV